MPKPGDKYIVEIAEEFAPKIDTSKKLYRMKHFNGLVFDQVGLDKLEKWNPEEYGAEKYQEGYRIGFKNGYERGCLDTKEEAKKQIIPDNYFRIGDEVVVDHVLKDKQYIVYVDKYNDIVWTLDRHYCRHVIQPATIRCVKTCKRVDIIEELVKEFCIGQHEQN